MKRAHKYRFNPTPDQDEQLVRTFGCAGLVYSKALEERTRAYALEGRRVFYAESSAAPTAWKRSGAYDSLPEVSSLPRLQVLQHLRAAFASFFAKRAGYPAFRSRKESAGVGGVHPPGHPAARPPDDGRGGPAAQAATSRSDDHESRIRRREAHPLARRRRGRRPRIARHGCDRKGVYPWCGGYGGCT
ncbi:helix-turn-helix domain-containing protein [Nonomuraea sp. NPDC004186]